MMEKSDASECHCYSILVASFDDIVVAYASASLCYPLHATLVCTFDVVAKWEESVAAEAYACVLANPLSLFLFSEYRRLFCEELLPYTVAKHVVVFRADIHVDSVVAVGSSNAWLERQVHHFRTLAQPPNVSLVACKSGAVYAALLSCSDADGLSVLHVANRVALCVFECD